MSTEKKTREKETRKIYRSLVSKDCFVFRFMLFIFLYLIGKFNFTSGFITFPYLTDSLSR